MGAKTGALPTGFIATLEIPDPIHPNRGCSPETSSGSSSRGRSSPASCLSPRSLHVSFPSTLGRIPARPHPAAPRTTPGARHAVVISRSRSCARRDKLPWKRWCGPGNRRISARWSEGARIPWRGNSSRPVPSSRRTASIAGCMGESGPTGGPRNQTFAANGLSPVI